MFHPDTRFLLDLWTRAAGPGGRAPMRALAPEALGARLTRAIVIDTPSGRPRLALVGGWLEGLHGMSLKGRSPFDLWHEASATLVASSLLRCSRDRIPVVLALEIGARRQRIELAFVPVSGSKGSVERVLGLFTPLTLIELLRDETPLLTARLSLGVDQAHARGEFDSLAPRRPAA